MFSEVMEWEAKGDSLRKAGRFDDAVEAYRHALRDCFQWSRGNDSARACAEIREKIWAVQLEHFETNPLHAPAGSDAVEWTAAMQWRRGERESAERTIANAIARGGRTSGELLDRLAARWMDTDPEGALQLTEWACRLRGEAKRGAASA